MPETRYQPRAYTPRSTAGAPALPTFSGGRISSPSGPSQGSFDRPNFDDIRRRIPDVSVKPAAWADKPARSDARGPGGNLDSGAAEPKRGSANPTFPDLGKRTGDLDGARVGSPAASGGAAVSGNPVKRGPSLAADGTRSLGDRGKTADFNRRVPDAGGSRSGGTGSVGKGGSGGASQRDLGTKTDMIKPRGDQPKITDLRKRIPDVTDGKRRSPADGSAKPADGRAKPAGDISKLPGTGVGHFDAGKLADPSRRAGGQKMPGELKPGMKIVTPGVAGGGKGKPGNEALAPGRFSDRVKKGDLDALTRGTVGQKINLADQYRLAQQGDVARRLALHKNVTNVTHVNRAAHVGGVHGFHHHPHFHHRGWISPIYHRHCFEFNWWFGPSWYPSACWYPRWNPWVHWSWHHHCHPFWDPRPIWCRPVSYVVVAQPWIVWDVPVWTPLAEVPAGTWVDVQRPVVAEARYDLQVLAVRFVDPGHPDEKLGPRYRVWLRNNSDKPITQAFDVRLFATPGEKLVGNAPQAGVRVMAIEAGETQAVDIRLPFDATQAAPGAGGKPPFQYLHALADANREIGDVNPANNGAWVTTGDVLPVDPAAFETDPKSVAAGGELVLAGEGFGPEPGKVIVHLGNIEMEAEVLGWYDLGVRLKVPKLPLAEATKADLVVIRGDGAAANPLAITVNPPQR